MSSRIREIVDSFCNCRIMVIGDMILDHYAFGEVKRISPEAPIQILDVEKEEYRLGGAANVAKNLKTLAAQVAMVGITGDDEFGTILCRLLGQSGIRHDGVTRDPSRPTTIKTRLISGGHHLLRTDREKRHEISSELSRPLLQFMAHNITEYDTLLISDYAKGVLTDELCERVIEMAKEREKKVIVGPKGKEWKRYRGAYLLSANRSETQLVTGMPLTTLEDVASAGRRLLEELEIYAMLITLGSEGMYLVSREGEDVHVKAEAHEVFDVAGAGDTVLAVSTLVISAGYPLKAAIRIANAAAGIVVGKVGVATASREEITQKFTKDRNSTRDKIKTSQEACSYVESERNNGKTVVFVYGDFDLLHPGHIRFLEYARSKGDLLLAGVLSDSSVRKSKGEKWPVMKESDRAEILAGLSFVDCVVMLEEPLLLLDQAHPDLLIKGPDSPPNPFEKEIVERQGGNIQTYSVRHEYSTSGIVSRIVHAHRTHL